MADKNSVEKENSPVSEKTQIKNEKKKEEEINGEPNRIKSGNNKTYQQSLPHVLSDYGLQNNRQKKKKSAKLRKERRNKRRPELLEDDERDKEREKLKEEKYLSVVDDLHKLRNYYYHEYRDLLTEKIVRQRLEIKEKSEAMLALARQKEQEEREANKSKVKVTKHKLVHNEDFLKNVHITETARIVNLQSKLQKQGKLKSQSDIDEFWRNIKNPILNEKYFDKNGAETPDSVFGGKQAASNRPLSQINESAESSRPTTRGENWAVTQQYKHQHKGPGMKKNTTSASKQAMDKRFASVDMPPLHCFTMDLSEKPPDPEVISKRVQLKAIEKQRKKFMGKLHKMHQLAMANNALASRILAQHEDLTMFLQGPELSDLISDYYYNRPSSKQLALPAPPTPRGTPQGSTTSTVSTKQYPILPDILSRRHSDTSQPSEHSVEQLDNTQLVRANSDVTSEGKVRMIMEKPSSPLPLTMNEVMQHYKVIEATGLSTNWNNYMRAGKAM